MPAHITTGEAGVYAARRIEFDAGKGPTLYGRSMSPSDLDQQYVVYSYGSHWPLYIWHEGARKWFGNEDKSSVTTGRHRNYANPGHVEWVSCDYMRTLDRYGLNGAARRKLMGD